MDAARDGAGERHLRGGRAGCGRGDHALAAETYAIDIDANGDSWVRVTQPLDAARVRVSYQAGLAADWVALPEALRQGVARLVAHLFTHHDAADGGGPPAAVTALWRPWRRMRLGYSGGKMFENLSGWVERAARRLVKARAE
ncbi:hypothetical protein [Allosphingosinicella sp.]|uniref:hypothetical protein n=1 Tax=Allosphingosinicella sp. TaxID=2823234 RepID=UPI002FC20EA6